MKKIIVEDSVYSMETKKPIRKLELWEEEKGNTICRRLYIEGDTGRRNRYIDRFDIGDVEYKFTHRDVMVTSVDMMLEKLSKQYDEVMRIKDDRFNTYLDEEIKSFKSPSIKHIENFTYQKT